MNEQECFELISCASSQTQRLRIGRSRHRVLFGLVKRGYLIPLKEKDNPAFDPGLLAGLEDNTTLILTDKAKAWILALNPDDFKLISWFPRPQDVRTAQERLKE